MKSLCSTLLNWLGWLDCLFLKRCEPPYCQSLGASRKDSSLFNQHLERVESICFALVPIGLVAGAAIVWILLPLGFPAEYFDGTLGASATDVFMILLIGWACTVLSVPSYTALQAGEKPWLFTSAHFHRGSFFNSVWIDLINWGGSQTGWIGD